MAHDAPREIAMKSVVLCAALAAAAAPVFAQDLVARQGSDAVHLGEGPCTSQPVLKLIDPKLQTKYHAATATVQGRTFAACWALTANGAHLMYEDGDQGLVPLSDLKPELTA
jgi:hypothetical protein